MAARLGIVASKLIEAVSLENETPRRRSRVENIKQLQHEIKDFHKHLGERKRLEENDRDNVTFQKALEEAEHRQQKDQNVKEWLDGVKDVYYKVIDVCEELRTEETMRAQEKGKDSIPLPRCARPFPYSIRLLRCEVKKDDEVLRMTTEILRQVHDLKKDELKLDPKERGLSKYPAEITVVEVPVIYGREKETSSILPWMLHRKNEVHLISIIGEAGIGKTEVARLVFNEVQSQFHLRAWVNISEGFRVHRIAQDFVEDVTSKKINKVELDVLTQRVREVIRGKRYVFVLDGVPDEQDFESKWEELMRIFNCGAPGCTILMTTRHENNAVVAEKSRFKKILAPLSRDDCWSIIKDAVFGTLITGAASGIKVDLKVFRDGVGGELVEKCKGLPVIAKALGVVLHGRTRETDWRQVLESDIWKLATEDKPYALKATMFSYYYLPSELRQCLLYCSIFPRNHQIDVNKLTDLWMAQDSIGLELELEADQEKVKDHDRKKEEAEDEGWKRFKELLERSIFQEYSHQDDSGSFKCKLQGAMSDFIRDITKSECHILTCDETKSKAEIPKMARHCTLNVVSPQASLPASIDNSQNLHTLMLLSQYSSIDPANLSALLSQMRRLRALDMSYCSMKKLPPEACELLHLRYLDLSFNRDLTKLPPAICNLINLQALNLNGCDDLRELPKGIGKLTKLRHLDILWTTNLGYLPKGITSLTLLTRLSRFFGSNGGDREACNLADLENLNKLQGYITIEGLGGETCVSEAGKAALDKKDLLGLELWFSVLESRSSNHEHILEALNAPPKLQCLGIFYYKGKFSRLPSWMTTLESLKHLIIADCKCESLPPLGRLQHLESLELKGLAKVTKVGHEFLWSMDEDSSPKKIPFPKLQKLHFQMLDSWERWKGISDERQPMPSLSFLSILGCPKLKELPNYIKTKEKQNLLKIEPKDFIDGKMKEPNKGAQKQ